MQEPIFVEKPVEHASVNLLLLDIWRLFELLHGPDQLFDSLIHLIIVSREHLLEMLVGSSIDGF